MMTQATSIIEHRTDITNESDTFLLPVASSVAGSCVHRGLSFERIWGPAVPADSS